MRKKDIKNVPSAEDEANWFCRYCHLVFRKLYELSKKLLNQFSKVNMQRSVACDSSNKDTENEIGGIHL